METPFTLLLVAFVFGGAAIYGLIRAEQGNAPSVG
jgi:hypothetical protein